MEKQANQIRYDAQFESAEVTQAAAMEAAKLHAFEHVLSRVGSKIANDIQRGLEMRF